MRASMRIRLNACQPTGLVAAAVLLMAGCGQLEEDNAKADSLAVVYGRITAAAGLSATDTVRVALVWVEEDESGGDEAAVTQEVEVGSHFPASFELPITSVPPEAALSPADGNGARGTWGFLLAYVDRDGNGRLDLKRASGSMMPSDTLVGAVAAPLIEFVENGPREPSIESYLPQGLPTGFSLVDFSLTPSEETAVQACWDAGGSDCEALAPAEIMPIDTPVSMSLLTAPSLPYVVCDMIWGDLHGFVSRHVDCGDIDPSTCAADLQVAYKMCGIPEW